MVRPKEFKSDEVLWEMKEIAKYIGVSRWTIYRWSKTMAFPYAHTPNGRVMTTKTAIDDWIRAQTRIRNRRR